MRAFAIDQENTPAHLVDLPDPEPGPDEVLIRVRNASVNGFDVYQASGYLMAMMEHRLPAVIGRDLAGVVESPAAGFQAGDEVFGFVPSTPPLHNGTFAGKIAAGDLVLAHKPSALSFDQAAALPLAGSAALDMLEAVELEEGGTVLIVGATGGAGSLAVQLAAMRGAVVVATGLPEDEAFLRDLGATQTVDRSTANLSEAVRELYPDGVDALIDGATQKDALTELGSVVRSGGRAASLLGAADVDHFASRGITAVNVAVSPTSEKLDYLAELVTSGKLRVPIEATYPLDRAAEALEHFQKGKRGKIVLSM